MNGYHNDRQTAGHIPETGIPSSALDQPARPPAAFPSPRSSRFGPLSSDRGYHGGINGRVSPFQSLPLPGVGLISVPQLRPSNVDDGIHLPRLEDRPAPQFTWHDETAINPVRYLISEVDAIYGPPPSLWRQSQSPDRRRSFREEDFEYFRRQEEVAPLIEELRRQRRDYPGRFHTTIDGRVVYVAYGSDGQPVMYCKMGPPTNEWYAVPSGTGDGEAVNHGQLNGDAEVLDDHEDPMLFRDHSLYADNGNGLFPPYDSPDLN